MVDIDVNSFTIIFSLDILFQRPPAIDPKNLLAILMKLKINNIFSATTHVIVCNTHAMFTDKTMRAQKRNLLPVLFVT